MTILKTFYIGKTKIEQIYFGAQIIKYRIDDKKILSSDFYHKLKNKLG